MYKNYIVTRYTFEPYFDGYFQEGNFFNKDGKMLKEKYYNKRNCLNCGEKRYGIRKLRKFAKRKEVEIENLPF